MLRKLSCAEGVGTLQAAGGTHRGTAGTLQSCQRCHNVSPPPPAAGDAPGTVPEPGRSVGHGPERGRDLRGSAAGPALCRPCPSGNWWPHHSPPGPRHQHPSRPSRAGTDPASLPGGCHRHFGASVAGSEQELRSIPAPASPLAAPPERHRGRCGRCGGGWRAPSPSVHPSVRPSVQAGPRAPSESVFPLFKQSLFHTRCQRLPARSRTRQYI